MTNIIIKESEKARNHFRSFFGNAYSKIGSKEIYKLQQFIGKELNKFKWKDKYSCHIMELSPPRKQDISYKKGVIEYCFFMVDCKTIPNDESVKPFNQWKRREAISFNKDGFIGFAGWASTGNEKPFVSAFNEWVVKIC